MEQQGTTTQEIARNVQDAASGTSDVTQSMSGVNEASQEAGSSVSKLLASASALSQHSELLRTEVDRFMEQVRAA